MRLPAGGLWPEEMAQKACPTSTCSLCPHIFHPNFVPGPMCMGAGRLRHADPRAPTPAILISLLPVGRTRKLKIQNISDISAFVLIWLGAEARDPRPCEILTFILQHPRRDLMILLSRGSQVQRHKVMTAC